MSAGADGPTRRELVRASLLAIAVAAVVLVVAVLPAEYGVDPTGVGSWAGFTRLAATPEGGADDADAVDAGPLPEPLATFGGTWGARTRTAHQGSGTSAEGETVNVTVPVDVVNLTTLTATLAWVDEDRTPADEPTDPDLFAVTLIAPDGTEGTRVLGRNARGGEGNATATFEWRDVPYPRQVDAENVRNATRALTRQVPADTSGVGEWTVRVTLLEAGDAREGTGATGLFEDEGNAWTLTVHAASYRLADVREQVPTGYREDVTEITIAPGEGLEFKLLVREGDAFTYAWESSAGPVYTDFHAERIGETSDAFTRYAAGTFEEDAGALTAPFTGTHGWYWENRGDAPTTITLTTEGVYVPVGRV